MTENEVLIRKQLGFLHPELLADLLEHATVMDVPEHVEILRYGQYVKVVPIVLSGLVKVFTRYDEKELLLYYIQPNESCVMSFSAALENAPSEVFAVTEEASKLLVIPNDHLKQWTQAYPAFNRLFFSLYNARYNDLIETINHLLYQKLDVRVLKFLH
jgi:CRP/FNR family transcriptional regulator